MFDTHDRYYLMQFMDAWTETFSIPGKRTTGTAEGWFAIVGPNWKEGRRGSLPERAQRMDSPTNMVWLLGRTQTNGVSDYAAVHAIQRGYILMPLSLYPDGPRKAAPVTQRRPVPASVTPPTQVERLTPRSSSTPLPSSWSRILRIKAMSLLMAELARIGIEPGKPFRPESLGPEGARLWRRAHRGRRNNWPGLRAPVGRPGKTGWAGGGGKVGVTGPRIWHARSSRGSVSARILRKTRLYMHCAQDAEQHPLEGANRYRIHFEKGQTPPVRAFWSSLCTAKMAILFRTRSIVFRDLRPGSAEVQRRRLAGPIYPARASGGAKDSNWLPSPAAKFNLSLRMYWPKDEVLGGKWIPPAVTK